MQSIKTSFFLTKLVIEFFIYYYIINNFFNNKKNDNKLTKFKIFFINGKYGKFILFGICLCISIIYYKFYSFKNNTRKQLIKSSNCIIIYLNY